MQVNGQRLKAGQTRVLVDGDTVSFGVFKAPQSDRWDWLDPDDALEGCGLPVERDKFKRSRWQFKLRVLSRSDEAGLSGAGRVVRGAWKEILRCNDSIHTARDALCVSATSLFWRRLTESYIFRSRLRGVECAMNTVDPVVSNVRGLERPTTPPFTPPPDEYDPAGGLKADYKHGDDYFNLVEDPEALSWYHPDTIWLGQVRHKPDPIPYELPFAFKFWSSVYGIPQGLHPRWAEFSSAVYGDSCPDVGRESVLLQGVPPLPDWVLRQLTEEEILCEGPERARLDLMARHCEIERLYEEGTHVKPNTDLSHSGRSPTADIFACESVPAPPIPASLSPAPSKKRTLDAVDGTHSRSSIASDKPTVATLEPPRKRTKRDAHTKRGIQKHGSGSQITLPSTSISKDAPMPSAKVSRLLKRARPGDEGAAEERPAKRLTRATTVAQAATAPRPYKRRQPKLGDDEPVQERPAKRTTRAAKDAPTDVINRTASRSLKRQRPERDYEESLQHQERPAKRITRATSNAPDTMVDGTSRPVRHQRLTGAVASIETSEADDANTRRSTRLKSKLALSTQ